MLKNHSVYVMQGKKINNFNVDSLTHFKDVVKSSNRTLSDDDCNKLIFAIILQKLNEWKQYYGIKYIELKQLEVANNYILENSDECCDIFNHQSPTDLSWRKTELKNIELECKNFNELLLYLNDKK